MAAPSHNPADLLAGGLALYLDTMHLIRLRAAQYASLTDASTVSARDILNVLGEFHLWRERIERVRAMPGIGPYAQDQLGQALVDINDSTTAVVNAMVAAYSHIVASLPKDANGFLLIETIGPGGRPVARTFPGNAAAIVTLRTLMATLRDLIDPRPTNA